jgi:hypothetical protein
MDLFVYCGILVILGIIRVNQTKTVSESVGITQTGGTIVDCDLPIGSNLSLIREPGAYTIILEELGLM